MNVSEELRRIAVSQNACEKVLSMWKGNEDLEALMDMYWHNMDFVHMNDFPPVQFIEDNLKGKVEQYGLYCNERLNVENQTRLALYGTSNGIATYTRMRVGSIYLFHDSKMNLHCGADSFVYVRMFGNSSLNIHIEGKNAKVRISHYGGTITGDTAGVIIHEKPTDRETVKLSEVLEVLNNK